MDNTVSKVLVYKITEEVGVIALEYLMNTTHISQMNIKIRIASVCTTMRICKPLKIRLKLDLRSIPLQSCPLEKLSRRNAGSHSKGREDGKPDI